VDGIAYVVRTGGAWRQLTVDLPPWETVGASTRGHDAGKRTNGRKRHIIVDTAGCC
jgi:transposase